MLDRLPQLIDPIVFAEQQRTIQGRIPLTKLSRLADRLLDNNGQVEIDLSFVKEGRRAVVRGSIRANLALECRNCLEVLNLPLELRLNLAVVKSLEQAERLSGEYEPLMLEDEKILLHEIIEDELLLALPDFPRHEQECQPYQHKTDLAPSADKNQQAPTTNPFSVLAQLKNIGD